MFKRAKKSKKTEDPAFTIDINDAINISEKLSKMKSGATLTEEDEELLRKGAKLIELLVTIYGMWKKSKKRISSLLKMVFGNRSEKLKDLVKGRPDTNNAIAIEIQNPVESGETGSGQDQNNGTEGTEKGQPDTGGTQEDQAINKEADNDKKRNGGGGKNSADDYTAAVEIECKLDDDKLPGKTCPECNDNKLYEIDPKKVVRLVGNAPVTAFKFILQQTRCICGAIFTADAGDEYREVYNGEKYSPSALAAIIIIKYLMGTSFGKLEKIQKMGGIPLPATTQMNKIKIMALPMIQSIVRVMSHLSSNAQIIGFDDTRIRTLEKRTTKNGEATGNGHGTATVASGFDNEGHKVILFDFDVNKHAGEVLCKLLASRERATLPFLVSDGLPAYDECKTKGVDVNCNVHARRKVVEEDPKRETYVGYAVLECYKEIYKNDSYCKENGILDNERMEYHQKNSTEKFEKIKTIFDIITGVEISTDIREKMEVPKYLDSEEPNSDLYLTAKYFLNRYGPLTQVLRHPGVPLDTNYVERTIKSIILLRKNSLFFHNHFSARYSADILSLLETANHSQVNVFDYMEYLLANKEKVMKKPHDYLPWLYKKAPREKEEYWKGVNQFWKDSSSFAESSTAEGYHSSA